MLSNICWWCVWPPLCMCEFVTGDDAMQFIAWRRSLTSCPRQWCHYSQYSQYYKGYRVEWGGVCVCARRQWAYVFRCFSVSVQKIGRLPRSEVPGIVLLQGAVKILQGKIHLELRIPVFQRLHCNWHKIRRAAALCIWFEGAFWVPKWQLPGVFVIN